MKKGLQNGLSLAEILISLGISTLLLATLFSQYIDTKRRYLRTGNKIENTLDTQLIADVLRNTIRQAGFTPCVGIDHLIRRDMRNEAQQIKALEITDQNHLVVNHMHTQFGLLREISGHSLQVTRDAILFSQYPVIISDCYHAEIHSIRHLDAHPLYWEIDLKRPLFYTFKPPVYVGKWVEERIFLKEGTLFFGMKKAEALSKTFDQIAFAVKYRLVHVFLSSKKGESLSVDVKIRNP